MLSYHKLKDRPRDFLAATGLTLEEFQKLLPAFQAAYANLSPSERTREGKLRQRRGGGGAKGVLQRFEDKLLFILVYQKTNPLQTMHALQFDLSQPHANYWIHQLLPVLQHALAALGLAPERDASRLTTSPTMLEGAPAAALDCSSAGKPASASRLATPITSTSAVARVRPLNGNSVPFSGQRAAPHAHGA